MMESKYRTNVRIVLLLILLIGLFSLPPSVAAAGVDSGISRCISYSELTDALSVNGVVSFSLDNDCVIAFDDEIQVSGYVSIINSGRGRLVFDGRGGDTDEDNDTRFFSVSSTGSLSLENVTLQNGSVSGNGGAINNDGGNLVLKQVVFRKNQAGYRGGALYHLGGTITIDQSSFIQNATKDTPEARSGNGGAIYNNNLFGMMAVTITDSTFKGNHTGSSTASGSGHGGAIYNFNSSGTQNVYIFNSTFYGNRTGSSVLGGSGDGGGIYSNNYGGTMALNVFNSTFSANQVGSSRVGDVGSGGALHTRYSTLSLAGTILSNSTVTNPGEPTADCSQYEARINDGGYNLIEDAGECEFSAVTTQFVDPGLSGAPGSHGGSTDTISLSANSLAVDVIPVGQLGLGVTICGYDYADQDQRGEYRPGGEACDIGAYEIVNEAHPYQLPAAGFEPGKVTMIGTPLIEYVSPTAEDGEMILSIPSIGVTAPVFGVPRNGLGWDVQWLGDAVGYLTGTTFPTWNGNSALVGHKVNAQGNASVFSKLETLSYGDQVMIKAWEQEYVYQVRDVFWVDAGSLEVLEDSDQNMLTLITCDEYDPISGNYRLRVVVQAVLFDVR
ncbi:MAG: sortase [Anaerolineaceae bacterium]|nr:sortase [Anaerolineaceae bacterium]